MPKTIQPHVESRVPNESMPERRSVLVDGVYVHLAVFVASMVVLFLVNWITREPGGGWWMVWPLQIWATAWGLHLFGVAIATHRTE